jgi:hypothetical protein
MKVLPEENRSDQCRGSAAGYSGQGDPDGL